MLLVVDHRLFPCTYYLVSHSTHAQHRLFFDDLDVVFGASVYHWNSSNMRSNLIAPHDSNASSKSAKYMGLLRR